MPYAVNQVRFCVNKDGADWKSELGYRADLESVEKGQSLGPIPDAILTSNETGKIAIEVEISAKKPDDMRKKLKALVDFDDENFQPIFPKIWFYVPDERIKRLVENAREHLRAWDQHRISVIVQQDLLL